jgi:hypothetical protein
LTTGFLSELVYNNMWILVPILPHHREILALNSSEPTAMLFGRMAGDIATIASAFFIELPTGIGSIGTGLAVCAGSAGGLCPGGAVAMVYGGALVLQAGGSSLSAAIGLGKTANIMFSRGRGRGGEMSSQKSPRPPGFTPKWKKDG